MKRAFRAIGILLLIVSVSGALLIASAPSATSAPAVEKKSWRLFSTPEGGFAYSVAMGLIKVANQYNPSVELIVTTGKGTPASHQLYQDNEVDTSYSSTQTMYEVWHNEGVFSKNPVKYRTYQGVYLYTGDHFFIIRAGRTDIKSLSDLAGKKVFPWYRGSGSYDTFKLVLTKLGVWDKIVDRQMGAEELADALKTGAVDAIGAFTISGKTIPSTVKDIEMRVGIQIVMPSAKEKEIILKIPAITVLPPFEPTMFSKPVGVDKIWAFGNAYGWNFGPNEDTNRVYGIVKAWYEHAGELAAFNPGFEMFAKIGLEMNTTAIDSISDVPVHPGVAKYLKERGVWKSKWKVGDLYPRP